MNPFITFVSPFIVSWVGGIIKNHALSEDSSKALVRLVIAILSLGAALLTAWLNGGLPDTFGESLQTAGLAVINFVGATGIFHLSASARNG